VQRLYEPDNLGLDWNTHIAESVEFLEQQNKSLSVKESHIRALDVILHNRSKLVPEVEGHLKTEVLLNDTRGRLIIH